MIEEKQRYRWRANALGVLLLALLLLAVRDIVRTQSLSSPASTLTSAAN